jgi:CheY-specific phosphatase CheX
MDKEHIKTTLVDSCVEVFEKMLFVEVKEGTSVGTNSEVMGSIAFNGAFNGSLVMECSTTLAKELTLSLLGIDETEITEEKIQDNIKELVNMICGNMFCKLDENKSLVRLDIPVFAFVSGKNVNIESVKGFISTSFICTSMFDVNGKEEVFTIKVFENAKNNNVYKH